MTEIDISEQDSVTARVGDTLAIGLDETPSTGFTWTIGITGTAMAVAGETAAGNPQPRPGAPGRRTFVLNAAEPGQADVTLTLARPWDTGPAGQTRRIHVLVEPG